MNASTSHANAAVNSTDESTTIQLTYIRPVKKFKRGKIVETFVDETRSDEIIDDATSERSDDDAISMATCDPKNTATPSSDNASSPLNDTEAKENISRISISDNDIDHGTTEMRFDRNEIKIDDLLRGDYDSSTESDDAISVTAFDPNNTAVSSNGNMDVDDIEARENISLDTMADNDDTRIDRKTTGESFNRDDDITIANLLRYNDASSNSVLDSRENTCNIFQNRAMYDMLENERMRVSPKQSTSNGQTGSFGNQISYRKFDREKQHKFIKGWKDSSIVVAHRRCNYPMMHRRIRDRLCGLFSSSARMIHSRDTIMYDLFNDNLLRAFVSTNKIDHSKGFLTADEVLSIFDFHQKHNLFNAQTLFQVLQRLDLKREFLQQNILTAAIRYVLEIYRIEILQTDRSRVNNIAAQEPYEHSEMLNRMRYCSERVRLTDGRYDESYTQSDRYYDYTEEYCRGIKDEMDDLPSVQAPAFVHDDGMKIWRALSTDSFFHCILPILLDMPQTTVHSLNARQITGYTTSQRRHQYELHTSLSAVIIITEHLYNMGYDSQTNEYYWNENHWRAIRQIYHDLMARGCTITATPFSYFVDRETVRLCCAQVSKYLLYYKPTNNAYNMATLGIDHQRMMHRITVFDVDPLADESEDIRELRNRNLIALTKKRIFHRKKQPVPKKKFETTRYLKFCWADDERYATDDDEDDSTIELQNIYGKTDRNHDISCDKLSDLALRTFVENEGILPIFHQYNLPTRTHALIQRYFRLTIREFVRHCLSYYEKLYGNYSHTRRSSQSLNIM